MSMLEIKTDCGDTYHVSSRNLRDYGDVYKFRNGLWGETEILKSHVVSINKVTTMGDMVSVIIFILFVIIVAIVIFITPLLSSIVHVLRQEQPQAVQPMYHPLPPAPKPVQKIEPLAQPINSLVNTLSVVEPPKLAHGWKATTSNTAQCMRKATQALQQTGYDNLSQTGRTVVFASREPFKASIRCMPEKKLVVLMVATATHNDGIVKELKRLHAKTF